MAGCGISTDVLAATPTQEGASSLLSSFATQLILLGIFIGLAVLTVYLYKRSQKKEQIQEKKSFRPKGREK